MKQRNHKGQFVKNEFKSLQIEETRPSKPFPVVEGIAVVVFIIGVIVILDHAGYINIVKGLLP